MSLPKDKEVLEMREEREILVVSKNATEEFIVMEKLFSL